MKKYIFILFFINNVLSAEIKKYTLKVIDLIDFIINDQKEIFDYKDDLIYTDSLFVKDFNFNNFKYSKALQKQTNDYCKLYFVDNEIMKIEVRKNKQTIDLYLFNYKGLLLAKSPFLGFDIVCFDIENEKIFCFDFELKVKDEDSFLPIDYNDLKKIVLLDQNLNPKAINYLENLNFVAGSNILYKKSKIFEEMTIIRQLPNNKRFYDLTASSFSKLYYYLENSCHIIGFKDFRRFLIEIKIPFYSVFFWYKRFEQKFPKINGSEFKNIY